MGKYRLHLQGVERALEPGKTGNENVTKLNERDWGCWIIDLIGKFLGGDRGACREWLLCFCGLVSAGRLGRS